MPSTTPFTHLLSHPQTLSFKMEDDIIMNDDVEKEHDEEMSEERDERDCKTGSAFRNELKRPDLKGTFRCSICQKVFCHSSSLSRHRMQAHFKSYRCTLCRKEITTKPPKKPYKELNLAEKVELIKMAEENAGLSQASIAEHYSIAKSNVCRILQRKKEYMRAFESAVYAGSRKRKLKRVEDKEDVCPSIPPPPPSSSHHIPSSSVRLPPYGNETLRAHMYKQHEISRMFMCRCCNWAFPDKTSLHVHIQAKEEGKKCSPLVSSPPLSNGLPSAFSPLNPLTANSLQSLNERNVSSVIPLSFFPSPAPLQNAQSDELLNRLRERILLNQMFPAFGCAIGGWLGQNALYSRGNEGNADFSPSSNEATKAEEDENEHVQVDDDKEEIVVDNKTETDKSVASRQSSLSDKRVESPCHSGSSTDGFSPSHNSPVSSPLHKQSSPPCTLQSLNLDASSSFVAIPHVSPAETHSTASPQGDSQCFECNSLRTRIAMVEGKNAMLESRNSALQEQVTQLESTYRNAEASLTSLRSALIQCQEDALRLMHSSSDPHRVVRLVSSLVQSSVTP